MFWVILIIIVLFIGFIIDAGSSSRPSTPSEKDRSKSNNKKIPPTIQPRHTETETTTHLPKGTLGNKGAVENKRLSSAESEKEKSQDINGDAETTLAPNLANTHGGEYLLAEKITDLVGRHINDQESALEFVKQELDGASKANDEARKFAQSLGFLEGEYSGALRKDASDKVENAQQAILSSSISFANSPEQATRLRLFNVKNIVERWGLVSPEVKNSRLIKVLREIALDDVNLVPSLDASLPIIKTANLKHISNRKKNLDFSRAILSELSHSLGKSSKEILLLAVPELLEVNEGGKARLEPLEQNFQKTQERKSEAPTQPTRKSEIRSFVEERGIPYLVHFTDFRNLPGIMSEGLLPRADLETEEQGFYYNDEMRLDGVKESISTSIAFPNYKMFFRYRQEADFRKWAVLLIDNSVFWENDCFFCKHNAADRKIINGDRSYLASPAALKSMYDNEAGDLKRDFGLLKSYDPTDPQAEVLVLSKILPEKINAVIFDSLSSKERFSQHYPMKKAVVDATFFSSRDYVRRRQVI